MRTRRSEFPHTVEPSTRSLEAGCTNLEGELLAQAEREMDESWNWKSQPSARMVRAIQPGDDEFRGYPVPLWPSAFDQQAPSGPTRHLP